MLTPQGDDCARAVCSVRTWMQGWGAREVDRQCRGCGGIGDVVNACIVFRVLHPKAKTYGYKK